MKFCVTCHTFLHVQHLWRIMSEMNVNVTLMSFLRLKIQIPDYEFLKSYKKET